MSMAKNQKGFTLIEIIAVLVILGILAAVAVPRFVDFQQATRESAMRSAISAGASDLHLRYGTYLLTGGADTPFAWVYDQDNVGLGDFKATMRGRCGAGQSQVTITSGPSWVGMVDAGLKTNNFSICPDS